ncbi:hypothetical protein Tco_0671943 [Tanacetum coccineum]
MTPTKSHSRQVKQLRKGILQYSTSASEATKGTLVNILVIGTAEENIILLERTPEPKKKSKKEIEQERLSFAEAIRLQEQINEEQRAQITRDEEIARQWDEEERQRAMSEAKSTKEIDWNDPSVIRYHALKMKPKTVCLMQEIW